MQSWITDFVPVFKKDLKANLISGDLHIIFLVVGIRKYVKRVKDKIYLKWN